MSAVIRAFGKNFDVDAFLAHCTFPMPLRDVARQGETVGIRKPRVLTQSSLMIEASGADFPEFDKQAEESLAFFKAHTAELRRLRLFSGVENCWLDFGVAPKADLAAQGFFLPAELVQTAGELGLGIELSVYYFMAASSEDDNAAQSPGDPAENLP